MTVSELAHFTVKPGTDLHSGDGKAILEHALETISKQAGCLNVSYGATVENPEDLDMIVEWNELSDHEKFQASEIYPSFLEKVFGLTIKDSLTLNHVHATPSLNVIADRAPVVEMLLIYVPASANDEVPGTLTRFLDILEKNATGFVATSHGWVVEELDKEGVIEKLKGYFVAIGWESVDAHMAYRDTEPFKENIPMVRALAKGLRVHHTSFTSYKC